VEALFLFIASCDDFFMDLAERWVVGIDEVGRGALAGPVVVAAAAIRKGSSLAGAKLGKLKDSKKLSVKQREAWFKYLNAQPNIYCALARVYPRQIEKQNISRAANIAAERALERLFRDNRSMARAAVAGRGARTSIFLDGGLYIGNGDQPKHAKTIIKGDEKFGAVKVASIFAKVHRDHLMRRLAKKYPAYRFEVHKGYGTKVHRAAIKKHGPSNAHRLTFLGKSATMSA
jgi:ribonuclease HII